MGNPSNCNYASLKVLDAQIEQTVLSEGRYRRIERAKSTEFTPEEIATMVERWKEQHKAELIHCLQPGIARLTQKQCNAFRENAVHTNSDDVSVCFLFACKKCEHNNKSHKKIKQYNVKAALNGQITIREAAEQLGVDRNLVYKHMMDGKLKAERIKHGHKGRIAWGIYPEDFEEYKEWLATTRGLLYRKFDFGSM